MSALIRVQLSQKELQIEPGQKGELSLTIQNLGEIVDQYSIEIDGLNPAWYTIPVSEVSLFPQDQDTVRISLHPPAGSQSKAGNYDFNVRVTSREIPTERTSAQATLVILPVLTLELALSPKRKSTTKKGDFQVRLANPGNVDLAVDLEASDPEEGCHYHFEPQSVSLVAGQSKGVSLVVTPKRKPLRGEAKRYDFTVKAIPTAAPAKAQVVTGSLEHRSALPSWVVPAAAIAVLFLCCGVGSVAGFAIFGEEIKDILTGLGGPTPTPRPVVIATKTPPPPTEVPTSPPEATPTPTATPGPPVIESFTANPATITAGETFTLGWGPVSNATSVEIDQGIGTVTTPGSVVVSPATTTTYTMTTVGPGGTTTASVTVTVNPAGPTVLYHFVDEAPSAIWYNNVGDTITFHNDAECLLDDSKGFACWRDNRSLEDGSTPARFLVTHPKWEPPGGITGRYEVDEVIQAGDVFRTKIGFVAGGFAGDAKWVLGYYDGGIYHALADKTKGYNSSLEDFNVDLSSLAGKKVDFTLTVWAGATSAQDWAIWLDAKIVRP